ncbi:ParA family protein [Streptomyces sp. NBC_01422]|uniref:ParA family protein n=1 Tax=Streptomyces sp. NBC_01422 TaxID=2903859 RepID=UPI002E2CAD64|nr:ParA family protein [Streptomyces sp. NBC_01422]
MSSTTRDDRAKVVALVQQKGGSGKSTLAVNLAAVSGQNNPPEKPDAPCPVVAAGIDRQGSLEDWSARVPEDRLPFDYVVTKGRIGEIPDLVADPAVTRIFVDTPGFMETDPDAPMDADPLGTGNTAKAMEEVLGNTDLALVPITPDWLTHRPAEFTIERVLKPRGVKFLVVINMWDSGNDREKDGIRPELEKLRNWARKRGYPFAAQAIRRYKIHAKAPEDGLTVIQYPESGTSLRAREDFYKLALSVEQAL